MICTSEGDTFSPDEYPDCFFSRKYRNSVFTCYNLKYDSGALVQHMPIDNLDQLRLEGSTEYEGYKYKVIGNKCFTIIRGKNSVTIYDLANFYKSKLEVAAQKYLGEGKIDLDPNLFTDEYIIANWETIAKYCIHDAVLCKRLTDLIISMFEEWDVFPRKLYSTAYVSWVYFRNNCPYVHVKGLWEQNKRILDFALASYNGGKFEVTEKGPGYFFEYDIVSAYPDVIRDLVDIRMARVIQSKDYIKEAVYGFIHCAMDIPHDIHSPVAVKNRDLNVYPVGVIDKVITKEEYDYLLSVGVDIDIYDAYWFVVDKVSYPYREAVDKFMKYKDKYEREGDKMRYHTVKTLLNSFYGKLCQLIKSGDIYKAGASWNPIYASVITAVNRIRVSDMQQRYPSVVAVHTDSVISTEPLPFSSEGGIGDFLYECEGEGIVLGSGIYQVGNKSKLRGFDTNRSLLDILPTKGKQFSITKHKPFSWREVAHRKMDMDMINRFTDITKDMDLNFDRKRIWLEDYKDWSEVRERSVISVPWAHPFFQ